MPSSNVMSINNLIHEESIGRNFCHHGLNIPVYDTRFDFFKTLVEGTGYVMICLHVHHYNYGCLGDFFAIQSNGTVKLLPPNFTGSIIDFIKEPLKDVDQPNNSINIRIIKRQDGRQIKAIHFHNGGFCLGTFLWLGYNVSKPLNSSKENEEDIAFLDAEIEKMEKIINKRKETETPSKVVGATKRVRR